MLMKKFKDDTNRGKDISHSWKGKYRKEKVLSMFIYEFNLISPWNIVKVGMLQTEVRPQKGKAI